MRIMVQARPWPQVEQTGRSLSGQNKFVAAPQGRNARAEQQWRGDKRECHPREAGSLKSDRFRSLSLLNDLFYWLNFVARKMCRLFDNLLQRQQFLSIVAHQCYLFIFI